jgi:hypothetical protein
VLRFINIGLFVWGMFVYRRLFSELKITPGLRNVTMFVFVLLPVVPLLAGQINYDNFILPLTGLLFIYVARYIQRMRGRLLSEPLVSVWLVLQILLVGAIGSLVKFAFAPLFFGAIVAMGLATIFYFQLARIRPKFFGTGQVSSKRFGRLALVLLAVCTAIAIGLCCERYGLNMMKYHAPVPKCDKILTIDECQMYAPWARDYLFASVYTKPALAGYLVYPFVWFNRMIFETLFTITSYIYEPWNTVTYSAYSPLMVGWVTAWVAFGIGTIGAAIFWQKIRRNRPLSVLLAMTAFYVIVLFAQNLSMYRETGEGVAIHGRYLIPVYPVLLVCLAIGWKAVLEHVRLTRYQGLILVVLTVLFLQGGGITNWLRRSDPSWYWQNSPAAGANQAVKTVIDPFLYKQVSVPPR